MDIENRQIHYKLSNITIDGIVLTNNNIKEFGLNLVFENEIADIYKFKKNSSQNIVNIKNEKLFNQDHNNKPSTGVIWDEWELESWIKFLKTIKDE